MKLNLFNNDEPLGLPKGSIRSIISMAFVGATIYSIVNGIEIKDTLLPITTMIVGFYYGSRTTE